MRGEVAEVRMEKQTPHNVLHIDGTTARRQASGPDGQSGRLVYWDVLSSSERYTCLVAVGVGTADQAEVRVVRFSGCDTSAPTDAWRVERVEGRLNIVSLPSRSPLEDASLERVLRSIVTEELRRLR